MMQGQLEISSTLAREAGVDELAEQREPFLEVMVVEAIMVKDNGDIGGYGAMNDKAKMGQDLRS